MLPYLKQIELDICEQCVYGKHKRVRFLRVGNEKKRERLDLVDTDVWATSQVSSLGGSHYYVTFIDDATRKTWVYCIRQKSDVLTLLRNGKIWLRMRHEKGWSVLDSTMEVNISARSLIIIIHTMEFIDKR